MILHNILAYVSEKEGIVSKKKHLHIIAQKADGALRDALSIFDQIISFSGNEITYQVSYSKLKYLIITIILK